ncbi:MAG TPA: heme lyase CcmF/NrfE family subunit [Actinomycetota bacterium]|nr:heme lyase CcmF/NrfE family subunit [Actinomycetota bacterium]
MDRLGPFALALSLALALYGLAASVIGIRRGRPQLVESARTAAYSLFATVVAANGAMLAAILANDFSIRYVAENSSRETPTFFKVLSLWSADEGSLLLWNLILAGFIAAVAVRFRRRKPETFPWAMAVMYAVSAFYLILVLGPTSPFETLASVPADGRGPLPLLQNHPLMAAHPPMLYLGFIGFTVPFAFAMAALITGNLSDRWIRLTRRWTLTAWIFLTVGLVLGALWSYGVLGWGGYWAWDPVENVALLPWLAGTAFLHSVIIQERRGMLKVWNLSLVVGAFALTTFGTFLTRGSILSSVHAFAKSLVGPMYLGFLVVVLLAGFGLIAARSWRLRSEGRFDSALSREAVFLGNNVILVAVTLVVLIGTIFPLAVEALSNRQVTVGGPYFGSTTGPLFLVLLFLMGVGPLLPWRRTTAHQAGRRLTVPAAAGALVMAALAVGGVRSVAAVAAFGLAAFVIVANVEEIARGVRSYASATGTPMARAARDVVSRNRRLYGGLVAHLGIAVAAIAITASSTFGTKTEVTLAAGQQTVFAGTVLRFEGIRTLHQPQRDVIVADVSVVREGLQVGRLHPSLNRYPASTDPIGTPSIRYGALADMYSSLIGVDPGGTRATFRFFINPGVMWLWVGGFVVASGGLLAAWPAARRQAPVSSPLAPAGSSADREDSVTAR